MKTFNNANHLTGTVLAALACVAFVGCTDSAEHRASTTDTTVSNTTLAADDTPKTLDTTGEVPPAAADTNAGSATSADTATTTETKTTKSKKSKAKKAHKKGHSAWVAPAPAADDSLAATDDDNYVYDTDFAETRDAGSMDVSDQYQDETISGVTTAPDMYRETGLSPFAQEPNSRMPKQIGSGQITGEDKSTTILEGPSLFQDPAALGRDLIR